MKKPALTILLVSIILGLAGCGQTNTKSDIDSQIEKILSQKQSPIVFESEPSPVWISVKTPKELQYKKIVNVAIKSPINIIAAINFADRSLSVSTDPGVDLNKKFIINFKNQTLDKYFDYLTSVSGYSLTIDDGVVYIRSISSKTWDLQSLSMANNQIQNSSKSDIGSDEGGEAIANDSTNDGWESIVRHVRVIMNSSSASTSLKTPTVVVTDNQQLGTISAIGLPSKIEQVDSWINHLIDSSNRQVHLQVQVLDVSVDESVGQGINWNLISKQSSQLQIGTQAEQVVDGAGVLLFGTPADAAINFGKKISLDLMLNLLRKQGKVRVDNQPNITVSNGREAYITTGDQFSFVSSIASIPDANGNVVTTSNIERMSVGVDMRVTPKILPDNRLVVNIVPIISSLKSFTTLKSATEEFKTPNIALQKLTTQVIVESGKTIHLGGLIASKVTEAAKGLPGGGIFDALFQGEQQSLERREIVILITPTIVR